MITNYLSSATVNQSASTSGWVVTSGSATTINSATKQLYSGLNSLALTVENSNPLVLSTEEVVIPSEEAGKYTRAFVWIYVSELVSASVTIYSSYGGASLTPETSGFVVRPLKWTLLSVLEAGNLPENLSGVGRMEVRVEGLEAGDVFYLAHPAICTPDAVYENDFAVETFLRCPAYLQNADPEQTDPDFPLLRFIDTFGSEAGKLFSYWEEFRYDTPDDFLIEKKSTLVTPDTAEQQWLNWLAQFVGVKLVDPSAGSSSWLSLLSGADTNNDGVTTWTELVTAVDDTAPSGASWAEVQSFAPAITNLLEVLRWQVSSSAYGFSGGTTATLKAAAQQGLSGTKSVTVTPNYGGDPWAIQVAVLTSEAGSVGEIEDLLTRATPAGFEIVVTSS
jgi:hypothetical protein